MRQVRINPIVVKELRQGLKSKSFLICFLGLQAFMVLCMTVYFQNADSIDGLQGADGFFWTMIGLALLFFLPLRSLFSIYNELRGNTLELLYLTHMRSAQIVGGKWMAQAIQGLMLICSVLPYFVLRYLLGRVNIIRDFRTMGILFLVSMVLLGAGTGMSAWKSRMLRFFVLGGGFFSLMGLPGVLMAMAMGGGSAGMFSLNWNPVTALLLCLLAILYFIEHGAALIAPPAENHARPKRILILLLFLVLLGTGLYAGSTFWLFLALALPCLQNLEFLSEPVSDIATIYKKSGRFPFLRWFFLPGWVSSLAPTLLMMGIALICIRAISPAASWNWSLFAVLFTLQFFPVAVLELFRVSRPRWRGRYLIVQTLVVISGIVLMILEQIDRNMPAGGTGLDELLFFHPLTALFHFNGHGSYPVGAAWTLAASAGIPLLIFLPRTLRQMRARSSQVNSPNAAHDE